MCSSAGFGQRMTRFPLGPALLPFGTLLTGSTIGTNNEKSTKVWTGDAENTPVELVAYNSDGTLPTNQMYDDIVTDANITAPAIVDINSNNHATASYKGDGTPIQSIAISGAPHDNLAPYLTRIYKVDNNNALVIIGVYEEGEETRIFKYNLRDSTLTSDGIYYGAYRHLYPKHIAKINDTIVFIADDNSYIFLDVTNGRVLSKHEEYSYMGGGKKNSGATAFSTALPFNLDTYNKHDGQHYYSYQVGNSIWLLGPNYNTSDSHVQLKIVKLNITISSTGEYSCSYNTSQVVTSDIANYSYRHMVPDVIEQTLSSLKLLVWTSPATDANAYVIVNITESTATVSGIKTVDLGFTPYNTHLPSIMQSGKISDNIHYIIAVNEEEYKYGTLCARKISISNDTVTAMDSLLTLQDRTDYTSIGASIPINDDRVQILIGSNRDYLGIKSYDIFDIDFNTSTIKTARLSDSPAVIASDFSWYPEVIDNTFLCAYPIGNNPYYSLSVAYMDPSDYTAYKRRKNVSTKALAVTSGNIGDTVRIAYEGTYHVPGVPTGSIYNTDTSYAIAKKSGVLTVSEPQQTSKVYCGSYVGDGVSGKTEDKPMSITFPFEPTSIWMFGYSDTNRPAKIWSIDDSNSETSTKVDVTKVTESFTNNGAWTSDMGTEYVYHKVSSDRKTYYWYGTVGGRFSYNTLNITYYFIAFG